MSRSASKPELMYATAADARNARARADADAQRIVANAVANVDGSPRLIQGHAGGRTGLSRPANTGGADPAARIRQLEDEVAVMTKKAQEQMELRVAEQRKVQSLRKERLKLQAENNFLRLRIAEAPHAAIGDDPLGQSLPATRAESARAEIKAAVNAPLLTEDGQRPSRRPATANGRSIRALRQARTTEAWAAEGAANGPPARHPADAASTAFDGNKALVTQQAVKVAERTSTNAAAYEAAERARDTERELADVKAKARDTERELEFGKAQIAKLHVRASALSSTAALSVSVMDAEDRKAVDEAVRKAKAAAHELAMERTSKAAAASEADVPSEWQQAQNKTELQESWRANTWAETLNLHTKLAEMVIKPLHDASWFRKLPGDHMASAELAFLRSLGASVRRQSVLTQLLGAADCSRLVAETLTAGMQALTSDQTVKELSVKFTMNKLSEFYLCDIKAFYDGLEEAVGVPNPDLKSTMTREHTMSSDSEKWFSTSNYSIHTTSLIEWHFVVDPEGGKRVLGRLQYPGESGHGIERRKKRCERPLETFDVAISDINQRLREQAQRPLRIEEFIAARLYTGPMFQKYNSALRAKAMSNQSARPPDWMIKQYEELCKDNKYTTTIWVLNSAIVKLKALTPAAKVYRGLKGLALPKSFRCVNEHGIRGGVEPGFMSTTLDYGVAMQYASDQNASNTGIGGIVFEIQQGLIDRGCDLSWLSQYPFEREILFAPLTGIEVLDTRVDGSVLVVGLRPTTNQNAPTIDAVISRLQSSHLQFLDLHMEEFKRTDAPETALAPLNTLKQSAKKRDAKWFNEAENYLEATGKALDAREEVFSLLAERKYWPTASCQSTPTKAARNIVSESPQAIAMKMFSVAELCAANGKVDYAILLLHQSLERCSGRKGVQLHPRLRVEDFTSIDTIFEAEEAADSEKAKPQFARQESSAFMKPTPSPTERQHSHALNDASTGAYAAARALAKVHEIPPKHRLTLLKMLLSSGEVGKWAPTMVGLLGTNVADADRVRRCFIQFLESEKLIDTRPITIGNTLLACIDGKEEYQRGVLLANKKVPGRVRESGEEPIMKTQRVIQLPSDPDHPKPVSLVLPFGANDAGAVLRAAAAEGNEALLRALLEVGVSPICADEQANTALHEASRHGRVNTCRALLDHFKESRELRGMDPPPSMIMNMVGFRPYDFSLMGTNSSPKLRSMLKKSEADQEVDIYRNMDADAESRLPLLDVILSAREPTGEYRGDSGLHQHLDDVFDIQKEDRESVTYDVNAVSTSGLSALMIASFQGYPCTVRRLLQAQADPLLQTHGRRKCSALTMAVQEGNAEVVDSLLNHGCPALGSTWEAVGRTKPTQGTEIINKSLSSAMSKKLEFTKEEIEQFRVKELRIDHPPSFIKVGDEYFVQPAPKPVELREGNGTTALLRACQNGFADATKILISKRADVNARRSDVKRTPLIMAARVGSVPCIKMLLDAKADPFIEDSDNSTALSQAAVYGHSAAVELLAAAARSWQKQLQQTPTSMDEAPAADSPPDDASSPASAMTSDSAIWAGVPYVDRREKEEQQTALVLAARRGHLGTVQALIRQRASVDLADKNGLTALMWACKRGYDAIIPLLVAQGVAQQMEQKPGESSATPCVAPGTPDDVGPQYVRQHELTDKNGWTPLMHAAYNGHVKAAEMLVVEGWDLLDRSGNGENALMLAAQAGVHGLVAVLTSEMFESRLNWTKHKPKEGKEGGETDQSSPRRKADVGKVRSSVSLLGLNHGKGTHGRWKVRRDEVLNARDSKGWTALMHASHCLHALTVRTLLHAGADRHLVDCEGRTAQMLAHNAPKAKGSRKADVLKEFRGTFNANVAGNPPLCALRGKEHVSISSDDMYGVGAFVVDVGTGACKLILCMRFGYVSMKELVEVKDVNWEDMFNSGRGAEDDRFIELVRKMHNKMEDACNEQQMKLCLITNVCLGVTAWYRQMEPDMREKGKVVLDALRDSLKQKATELSSGEGTVQGPNYDAPRIDAKWIEVQQHEEAMWEHKSVEFALHVAGVDAPLALLAGGQGSVQLSGLDGFTSFDLKMKEHIKKIESHKDGIQKGLDHWRDWVRSHLTGKSQGQLTEHLKKAAAESQEENTEPVRIVLISSLFYLASEAGLVQKESYNYAYQPASVVIEALARRLEESVPPLEEQIEAGEDDKDDKKKRETIRSCAGAVQLSEILAALFDSSSIQRVELLFARDWCLHDTTGKAPPNFRTTWTAGWWLEELDELYRMDTRMDIVERGDGGLQLHSGIGSGAGGSAA